MADLPQARIVSLPPPSTDELLEQLRVTARARATSALQLIDHKIGMLQGALAEGLSIDNELYVQRLLEGLSMRRALLHEALASTKAYE